MSTYASTSAPATMAGVQFQVNGVNLGLEATSAPYQTSWNTSKFSKGPQFDGRGPGLGRQSRHVERDSGDRQQPGYDASEGMYPFRQGA